MDSTVSINSTVATLERSVEGISLNETSPAATVEAKPASKKKKRKPKKTAKAKEEAALLALDIAEGPWLQLPVELLESLMVLNSDPATLSAPPEPLVGAKLTYPTPTAAIIGNGKSRDRGHGGYASSDPSVGPFNAQFPFISSGKVTPPPIDPGVFRSVASIRRLIDEASELSVRATSGLSNIPERGGNKNGHIMINNAWPSNQTSGIGDSVGGRNMALSAMRIHRLRILAVQKLAQAYKADEIASSVMVMQGGSVFEDLAEKVLRHDPTDPDARYVHFFHEKIPSRQLSESTTTQVLDDLIAAFPQRLEYYRTRGIVHTFRDEYPEAIKDFTHAIKESRLTRKAKSVHKNSSRGPSVVEGKRRKVSSGYTQIHSVFPGEANDESGDGEPAPVHPSVMDDAPDPLESQLLFMRGSAYLRQAVFLIEAVVLKIEGVKKRFALDGSELRLSNLEGSRFGGVETGNPDGPLGRCDKPKRKFYKEILAEPKFKEQIIVLVKKSMRDLEKFLSHFDTLEGPTPGFDGDLAHKTAYAFLLSETTRPGNHSHDLTLTDPPSIFSTYHPLIVECHFTLLLCYIMLMSTHLPAMLTFFHHTAALVDGLEGYPVFLPPRSMAHAEFVEILERLTAWQIGIQPHSLLISARGQNTLEVMSPPHSSLLSDERGPSPSSSRETMEMSSSSLILPTQVSNNQMMPDQASAHTSELKHGLDCLRILLHPVLVRQRKRAAEKASVSNKTKKAALNIPLHGPRVEIILAWLGANALDEFESIA